jgi:hypothetical protein
MSDNFKTNRSDLEGDREPKDLKRGLIQPKITVRLMPSMSDDALYLPLNVPQGLETNGTWPKHYGIVQESHPGQSDTSIKTDDGR